MLACIIINTCHNRDVACCVSVATAAYRARVCVSDTGCLQRNPCWPGWRPAGGRGHCVYACHRVLESSMAQTDASDY